MSNGYFLIDANTFVYAYRAGGAELLDKYVRMAIMDDRKLAITRTVWGEIEKGPLGPDILSYVSERGLQVLEAKGTEAEVLADPRKRAHRGILWVFSHCPSLDFSLKTGGYRTLAT